MSQILHKREKEMTKDEKIRLELMRTVAAAKGENLRNPNVKFQFSEGSKFWKAANMILERFNVNFKDQKQLKLFWPENDLEWPNKQVDINVQTKETPNSDTESSVIEDELIDVTKENVKKETQKKNEQKKKKTK